eukprot:scaffold24191_cov69-Phaeocystis_antarctica.AAC.3
MLELPVELPGDAVGGPLGAAGPDGFAPGPGWPPCLLSSPLRGRAVCDRSSCTGWGRRALSRVGARPQRALATSPHEGAYCHRDRSPKRLVWRPPPRVEPRLWCDQTARPSREPCGRNHQRPQHPALRVAAV